MDQADDGPQKTAADPVTAQGCQACLLVSYRTLAPPRSSAEKKANFEELSWELTQIV